MTRHKPLAPWILLGIALGSMGASDSCGPQDLLHDPTLDLWCGDALCSWAVEEGEVVRTPTWHEEEDGAALVGDPVVLSQLAAGSSDDVHCIEVQLLASVPDGANLTLELDFYDDGYPEHAQLLAGGDYSPQTWRVTPPLHWRDLRFRLRKTGEVDAVLAQIRALATSEGDCTDAPIVVDNAPDGALCTIDGECGGGHCATVPIVSSFDGGYLEEQTCGTCARDADCGAGTCGLAWDAGWYGHRECVAAGDKGLGEACAADGECGTGTCCEGLCSECCDGAGCDEGEACARHDGGEADPTIQPHVCDAGPRLAGAVCLAHTDCASGTCQASEVLRICDPDGRPCDTDADCPWSALGGSCVTVGAADGTCT